MALNCMHSNEKTDRAMLRVDLRTISQRVKPQATNHGVRLGASLKVDAEVSSVVKSTFSHLSELAKRYKLFSHWMTKILINE